MSNYIQDLRKLVGHRCIMQCAASIILEDDNGNMLLGRRTDNHMWGYFGGSMEIDESAEDCAKRELYRNPAGKAHSFRRGMRGGHAEIIDAFSRS